MKRAFDLRPMAWIHKQVKPLPPYHPGERHGTYVSNCIPPRFPAYAKVLHAILEDLTIEDHSSTWDELDKATLSESPRNPNVPPGPADLVSRSTLTYGSPKEPFPPRRVLWSELAERMELAFHPELGSSSFTRKFPDHSWPRYLVGPAEGFLDDLTFNRLLEILHPRVDDQQWFFYYIVMATRAYDVELLYEAELRDFASQLPSLTEDTVYGSPTYWFPTDRSCLVCSDWDLTFTLVGSSTDIIDAIIHDERLEALEVSSDTRIDYHSDRLNFPEQSA